MHLYTVIETVTQRAVPTCASITHLRGSNMRRSNNNNWSDTKPSTKCLLVMPRLDCVVTMALMPSGNTKVFCNTTGSGAWTEKRKRGNKEATTRQQTGNKQATNRQSTTNHHKEQQKGQHCTGSSIPSIKSGQNGVRTGRKGIPDVTVGFVLQRQGCFRPRVQFVGFDFTLVHRNGRNLCPASFAVVIRDKGPIFTVKKTIKKLQSF